MGMKISNRIVWYFVGAIALLFGLVALLPDLCCDDDRNVQLLIRQANLRSVAGFILNYPARHQGVLPNPNKWLEAGITDVYPEPAFGDNDQDDIWMCPIPWDDGRLPDNLTPYQLGQIPMLHNKVDLNPDGTSVAFWDGSVRLLSNEEFAAMVNVEDSVCLGCQFPVPEFLQGQEP